MIPLKTKRALLRSECLTPPREIRENTKARRQWLAEKLSEVNDKPNREAKIVGTGSYQSLSVYEVKEVEGRLRYRGTCQFCGGVQVVSGETVVLHGYKRPGDGQVYGRCPGMDLQPLNTDKSHTERWLADAIAAHDTARELLSAAEATRDAARRALYATSEPDESHLSRPVRPAHRNPTEEQIAAYKQAYQQWSVRYPRTAAHDKAAREYEAARQREWVANSGRQHFQTLIDSGVYGTPLRQEIVA